MPSYENDFKESNVNYLNKDFTQFKNSLINYAKSYFPNTYKDFNETSPGMMLIEMSAYVGDVLSFYIDQQYREMMLPLAEERRNIINMAKMYGYKVKPIIPAYADLTFDSVVNADENDRSKIDYSDAAVFGKGIAVASTADSSLIFETLEDVDFTISSSADTNLVESVDPDTDLIETYRLSRTVRAVSGETTSRNFTIGAPTKFLKLTLPDTNVIDIISCVDSNNNNWYEVDFLAQDRVPIPTHYTEIEERKNAYQEINGDVFTTDSAVPYSLEYIKTSKRFVRETNSDNTTSLVFGNGILKNGTTIDSGFVDLEQVGIVVPGQANDLNEAIDPLLGDEYSTLGETPVQTTLTITYRIGGGIDSNAAVGDLTSFTSPTALGGPLGSTIESVRNNTAAVGGKDQETVDEIRQNTKAFFSTQNRCVTKEDYEARVLNLPAKYGNIAKVYVSRSDTPSIVYSPEVAAHNAYVDQLLAGLDIIAAASDIENATTAATELIALERPDISTLEEAEIDMGTIRLFILAYDRFKNLIGNAAGNEVDGASSLPDVLKNNIKAYLSNFRLLTDDVEIYDGFRINFGVFFDVVAHKHVDKNQVKLLCIEEIKNYFKIEKMQFSQPIYISQLEYQLMGIEGVRGVNYCTITQRNDYNATSPGGANLPTDTYYYSYNAELGVYQTDGGTSGYGFKYDFENALVDGVIVPPSPANPGVFELKNPNQNIMGVVR